MKPTNVEPENTVAKTERVVAPLPPPPPPPLQRFWVRKTITKSITNQEIARYWRQKRIDEEDHLLAAIKAAARIRARNFSEEDYKQFMDSLKDEDNGAVDKNVPATHNSEQTNNKEVRVGIKDWWTKSKYAYLNQPAISAMETQSPKRTCTYMPNCFAHKPVPLYPTSLGVF